MKSKTVSSIMRHVASKLPSLQATEDAPTPAPAAAVPEPQVNGHNEGEKDELVIPRGNANDEERLEQLYDTIAWPLGKVYGHPYDAFKLALT